MVRGRWNKGGDHPRWLFLSRVAFSYGDFLGPMMRHTLPVDAWFSHWVVTAVSLGLLGAVMDPLDCPVPPHEIPAPSQDAPRFVPRSACNSMTGSSGHIISYGILGCVSLFTASTGPAMAPTPVLKEGDPVVSLRDRLIGRFGFSHTSQTAIFHDSTSGPG